MLGGNADGSGSVSTVRVGIRDSRILSVEEEDFSEPETVHHGRVAGASASPQFLRPSSGSRSILKPKAQARRTLQHPRRLHMGIGSL